MNRPSQYIVIRDCTAYKGGGLLTCGSETSGGIKNVVAYNLKSKGTSNVIRFKSAMNRGGYIKDIYITGVEAENAGSVIVADLNWHPAYSYSTLPPEYEGKEIPDHWKVMLQKVEPEERGYPHVSDIYIENIVANNTRNEFIKVSGISKELPLKNLWLSNLRGNADKAGIFKNTENVYINNVEIETADGSVVHFSDNKNVVGQISYK